MVSAPDPKKPSQFVDDLLRNNEVVLVSGTYCMYSARTKRLFVEHNVKFVCLEIDIIPNGRSIFQYIQGRSGKDTLPQVFVKGKFRGQYEEMQYLHDMHQLDFVLQWEGNAQPGDGGVGGFNGGMGGSRW